MERQCFQLPRCKRSAQRPTKAEVRGASPRGSTISNVDHVVTVSIPPCEGGGAGASPVGQPNVHRAHGEETNRRSAKPIHPVRVRGARPLPNSPVAQSARASDFDSEGDGANPSGAANFQPSRCSPMQRQRAQTSSSAGASPAAGTMEREPAQSAGFPC